MHGGGAHLDGTASLRRANLSVSLYSKAVFHSKAVFLVTTKQDAGVLQVLDFVFWAQDPIKKRQYPWCSLQGTKHRPPVLPSLW